MSLKTILIADDSLVMRLKIQDELEKLNLFVFVTAKDGAEAIEILKKQAIDGLILDLLMPNVDGYGVLKAIKKLRINIPIIVLTADIQQTTKGNCIDLGATAVLHKPFKPEELIDSVKRNFT